ncbi:hypothetical protein F4Y43_05245 [Candidatus Poribacteria bacterium]|nr:hypothetical protein [Candidatus Poribacteria bacterium]MYF79885.1 hypothetical protein [Chloroflexota bacterium]
MLPPLFADANIAIAIVRFLRLQGVDVVSAREEGWHHYEDQDILANAHAMCRFVLTHDSGFGRLAVHNDPSAVNIPTLFRFYNLSRDDA